MAQVIITEPMSVQAVGSSLLQKPSFIDQVTPVDSDTEDAVELSGTDKCQEILSKALQIQVVIQDSIEVLRERESERTQLLARSARELEQSQTVTLLILGMLNRRVLYEYPSILRAEKTCDESAVDDDDDEPASFQEEIALVRRTMADVAMADKKADASVELGLSSVESTRDDVRSLKTVFELSVAEWNEEHAKHVKDVGVRHVIEQTRSLFAISERQTQRAAELDRAYIERILDLGEPVWDVCADIKEMCDLLELENFDQVKDVFLRKMLDFAHDIPRQWPQATNFRSEVRSDVRCNLGMEKYGELRWHHD